MKKNGRALESNPRVRQRRTAWIVMLFESVDLLENECSLDFFLVLFLGPRLKPGRKEKKDKGSKFEVFKVFYVQKANRIIPYFKTYLISCW